MSDNKGGCFNSCLGFTKLAPDTDPPQEPGNIKLSIKTLPKKTPKQNNDTIKTNDETCADCLKVKAC